jgi:SNF2 family DNA or RNA helicase
MGKVVFKRGPEWDMVEIIPPTGEPGLAAEIGHLALTAGGDAVASGFAISSLTLRLVASELGAILDKHDAEADYDPAVLALLNAHLEEVEARQAASIERKVPARQIKKDLQASRFNPARELKAPQLENLSRLLELRHGANFSVPGAGKTTTLLALYELLHAKGQADRLLVVAPKNAFLSWEDELEACFPELPIRLRRLEGGVSGVEATLAADPEVCLITYQMLVNVHREVADWVSRHRTHVVLDESHRIKAGASKVTAAAALRLSGSGIRRDILSGTPMPQSSEDLRPQMEFLWPGQRILPELSPRAADSDDAIADIQDRMAPLYVRTTKDDLDLPALTLTPISLELGPIQSELYELLRSAARRRAAGISARDRAYLRRLGGQVVRLLEAATNPLLLAQGAPLDDHLSADQLNELLREFARHEKPAKLARAKQLAVDYLAGDKKLKVLLWTNFIANIDALAEMLAEFSPVVLHGSVDTGDIEDPDTREGRIRQFHNDPGCRVMVANPAACGEGISLHRACHYAIYVDRTFNAAHFLQSVDRIHRLGLPQEQLTRIDVLEARATIDTRVARRLAEKIDVMSRVLNDPGLAKLAYDPEDVEEEFPGGLEAADVEEVVDHLLRDDE